MRRTLTLTVALLWSVIALTACSTESQRKAPEHTAVRKEVALEVERICALPEPERSRELATLQVKSGFALFCAQD